MDAAGRLVRGTAGRGRASGAFPAAAGTGSLARPGGPTGKRAGVKIAGVDVFGYEVRYAHGEYVMSGGRAAATQTGTLVRLRTDDGLHGWGEITPLGATYLPTFTDGVRTALGSWPRTCSGSTPRTSRPSTG